MPAPKAISSERLGRVTGTQHVARPLDMRSKAHFATDRRSPPGASIGDPVPPVLLPRLDGPSSINIRQAGLRRSRGSAARPRDEKHDLPPAKPKPE